LAISISESQSLPPLIRTLDRSAISHSADKP
jgi:hypothetical protein